MGVSKNKKFMKTNKGFSFVEITVTLAIVAICILPILNLIFYSKKQVVYARDEIIAYNLAFELLEWINTTPYELMEPYFLTLPPDDSIRPYHYYSIKKQDEEDNFDVKEIVFKYPEYYSKYKRTIEVPYEKGSIKPVKVRVSWRDRKRGPEHSISLQTIIIDERTKKY